MNKNKLNFRRKQKIGKTTYVVDVPVVEKRNEAMGCIIRTGGQRDFAKDDPLYRKLKNARLKKNRAARQNVDEAYIDRLLGVSPDHRENG